MNIKRTCVPEVPEMTLEQKIVSLATELAEILRGDWVGCHGKDHTKIPEIRRREIESALCSLCSQETMR